MLGRVTKFAAVVQNGSGRSMKIGVMGGTFDPVHAGHLIVAEEVRSQLNLAEIIFVPAGQPWLKINQFISPAEHRLRMLALAIADKAHFKLSTIEIERGGSTYTVETIAEQRGQLGDGDEIFFILGWDSLAALPQWREPPRLIKLCRLVAVPRPSYPLPDLKAMEALLPGVSERVVMMDKPEIDISSSEIRDRVKEGLSIHHLVPESVEKYIGEHRLYLKR
ncbi:nicotinate-nucleotide adenylyltransferase [Chloroflexota bacterium]